MLFALDDTVEEEWRCFHAIVGGAGHALNIMLRTLNDAALISQV
jgi:hypothetical protein